MARRFVHDLKGALAEARRVLKPGGKAVYVMGPSILRRDRQDSAQVLGAVAESVGLRSDGHARRDIEQARRSLPPPGRVGNGEIIDRRMVCEIYIALVKP